MKKNLLTTFRGLLSAVLLLGLGATATKAQTAASYLFTPLPGTFTPVSGGTELIEVETDDASSNSMIPLGFTFKFCGVDYTEVKPNSNGWLSFGDVFPDPGEMRNNETYNMYSMVPMLQPLWDDLAGYNGGICTYTTEGTSPNQVFTMEWRNWTWFYYLGSQTISFQVKLYEGTNIIEYVYEEGPDPLDGFAEAATIGIANSEFDFQTLDNTSTNPTPSSTVFHNFLFEKPATGQIYRWAPPPPCSGTPDAGTATAATPLLPCEGSSVLDITGATVATELEYQWEYSTDGTTWFALGGPQSTTESNTGTITETTQFHCIVTCLTSGLSATSDPVTVTVGPPFAGGVVATMPSICNGATVLLNSYGNTTTGVDYQWQSSTDGVTFTNIGGATNPTYTTPALNNDMYYQVIVSCASSGAPATSTPTMVNVLPVTGPAVNPGSLAVECGDPVIMNATAQPGATLSWYDVPAGGTPLAVGSPAIIYPTGNTTYYVQNSTPNAEVTSMSTTEFAVVDHNSTSGDDRGGIALTDEYVYYTGDNSTARYDKIDLTNGISLPFREGFFSSNGELWQMGNAATAGDSYFGDDNVDMLYGLDEDLNLTGNDIALSQPVYLSYGSFVAPGIGYVLLYDGLGSVYHIEIATGAVTTLSTSANFVFYWSETWASYGWAELVGGNYNIVFREDFPSQTISKYDVTNDAVTPLQTFTDLSDMAAIAYDGNTNRMYFHHEGVSEFGGSNETLGWLGSTITTSGCAGYTRTPVQVTVDPITVTISPTGTVNICPTSTQTLTAMLGASYQWYLNGSPIPGATSQTYSTSAVGNYSAEVTMTTGCSGTSAVTTIGHLPALTASVIIAASDNTICEGESVTFTATPTNGGTGPAYQWTVNGVNAGTNAATYTTNTLADGDVVNVVMTVGTGICTTTPTATSSNVVMDVTTNVAPTITINANPGSTACVDDIVSFTTTITNSGTAPNYDWAVNGASLGINSPMYTSPAGSLSTGDVVSVTMTSNAACALPQTVTQNMTMTIDPLTMPVASIAADQTAICQGTMVTFTTTDNAPGGTYQWYVNGTPSGPNASTYTFAPDPGTNVSLEFTPPTLGCYENVTVSSNSIAMDVTPGLPTMATASAVPAAGEGTVVTVYANLFNFNVNVSIEWFIDGVSYTTTTVPYMSFTKGPGTQVVNAVVTNSGSGCYLTATTNDVTIETWTTSVANAAKMSIEIYPNPFSSTLVVKGLADGDQVYLLNALGQTIQQWNLDKVTPEQQLKINDVAAGSYLINIRDKDGVFKEMKKLQKQ